MATVQQPGHPVATVIASIDAAWRLKRYEGLEACFHEDAVILGPGYREAARGRALCAASYRDFAENADVLFYEETGHILRTWEAAAVHTFAWAMDYRRPGGSCRERGTDQQVFQRTGDRWELVWRHIEAAQAT